MCFGAVRQALLNEGVRATDTQIRWAINTGKIERPVLDRSLRFDFRPQHVAALLRYFRNRQSKTCLAG
jgi:hypothetical protein